MKDIDNNTTDHMEKWHGCATTRISNTKIQAKNF